MSGDDEVRYCHRFSYVFLKFILFFYAIIFWVSYAFCFPSKKRRVLLLGCVFFFNSGS